MKLFTSRMPKTSRLPLYWIVRWAILLQYRFYKQVKRPKYNAMEWNCCASPSLRNTVCLREVISACWSFKKLVTFACNRNPLVGAYK